MVWGEKGKEKNIEREKRRGRSKWGGGRDLGYWIFRRNEGI